MEDIPWSCYLKLQQLAYSQARSGNARDVSIPFINAHQNTGTPRNPNLSIAQPNTLQSCLPNYPRSHDHMNCFKVPIPVYIYQLSSIPQLVGPFVENLPTRKYIALRWEYMSVSRGCILFTSNLPCLPPSFLR